MRTANQRPPGWPSDHASGRGHNGVCRNTGFWRPGRRHLRGPASERRRRSRRHGSGPLRPFDTGAELRTTKRWALTWTNLPVSLLRQHPLTLPVAAPVRVSPIDSLVTVPWIVARAAASPTLSPSRSFPWQDVEQQPPRGQWGRHGAARPPGIVCADRDARPPRCPCARWAPQHQLAKD